MQGHLGPIYMLVDGISTDRLHHLVRHQGGGECENATKSLNRRLEAGVEHRRGRPKT